MTYAERERRALAELAASVITDVKSSADDVAAATARLAEVPRADLDWSKLTVEQRDQWRRLTRIALGRPTSVLAPRCERCSLVTDEELAIVVEVRSSDVDSESTTLPIERGAQPEISAVGDPVPVDE